MSIFNLLVMHEAYDDSFTNAVHALKLAAKGTNVQVLDNDVFIYRGVRFLGTTLWTDYRMTGNQPLAELDAQLKIADFKKIRSDAEGRLQPHHVAEMHSRARLFLEKELDTFFDGQTVVVSHHAPCELSIHASYLDKPEHLNAAYASRLDHLMGGDRVALWAHGHTHHSFDYEVYSTRVVCNPRGYAPDMLNPDFLQELVLTLPS